MKTLRLLPCELAWSRRTAGALFMARRAWLLRGGGIAAAAAARSVFLGRDCAGAAARTTLRPLLGRSGRVFAAAAGPRSSTPLHHRLLHQLHHTRHVRRRAAPGGFGLAACSSCRVLPLGRPAILGCPIWRASTPAVSARFLGEQALLIASRSPERAASCRLLLPPCSDGRRHARVRGAAVLWLTHDDHSWGRPVVFPAEPSCALNEARPTPSRRAA